MTHYPPADQLEVSLVAVTAIEDFSRAMQLAQALPEERLQFLAFLRIAALFVNR